MNKIFKTLSFCLLSALALVSCNDNYDDTSNDVTYPEKVSLGMWQNDYTKDGGTAYSVNITLNEKGDTICDITTYNTSNQNANVLNGGKITNYEPKTGTITVNYTGETLYGGEAKATLNMRNDGQSYVVSLYSVDDEGKATRKAYFTAVKAETISVLGDWQLADGRIVSLNSDGTASIQNGETLTNGTYTYNNNVVTLTTDGGTFTMSLNANGQMLADGQYVSHIMTQPKNDWYVYAYGNYTGGETLVGENYTNQNVELEYSPSRKMARFSAYVHKGVSGSSPFTLEFYWNIGDSKVTMGNDSFYSGITHATYGEIMMVPTAITDDGATALFENNVFYFGISYNVSAGSFGAEVTNFEITRLANE